MELLAQSLAAGADTGAPDSTVVRELLALQAEAAACRIQLEAAQARCAVLEEQVLRLY